jgi:hypothetical protein
MVEIPTRRPLELVRDETLRRRARDDSSERANVETYQRHTEGI